MCIRYKLRQCQQRKFTLILCRLFKILLLPGFLPSVLTSCIESNILNNRESKWKSLLFSNRFYTKGVWCLFTALHRKEKLRETKKNSKNLPIWYDFPTMTEIIESLLHQIWFPLNQYPKLLILLRSHCISAHVREQAVPTPFNLKACTLPYQNASEIERVHLNRKLLRYNEGWKMP